MTERGFHTLTLGCKLNQFDTAAIEAELAGRGFGPQPNLERAEVVVVNTCTVTGKADAEARKLVRSVRRRNPDCLLLVTGCYAEREPETLRAIEGVDLVFGNVDKPRLPGLLDAVGLHHSGNDVPAELATIATDQGDRGCDTPRALPGALHFGDRSRAFLRVQEGCDLRCSYCIIPQVRGNSRSVPVEAVLQALHGLQDAGYREVVLTGVNTGDWGRDLTPRLRLVDLLQSIFDRDSDVRIRLNSLEPRTVTDPLIDLFEREPRLVRHLQVPLQSGSPTILRRMRRNYRLSEYAERIEALRKRLPDIGLGADVIVGFPGETDELFEETYRFIAESPLNYLHVFSWSPRPGVPAASMEDRPHGTAVRERSRRLRELAVRLGLAFRLGLVGTTQEAVVLGDRRTDGRTRALTGNFVEVGIETTSELQRRSLVEVRITGANAETTDAVPA